MGRIFKFAETEIQHSGVTSKKKFDVIELLPEQEGTLTYNGEEQFPTWTNWLGLEFKCLISGEKSATEAGIHYITLTPTGNFGWENGTQNPIQIPWEIKRKKVSALPSLKSSLIYNDSPQTPLWNNYNPSELTIGGTYQNQTDADNYEATFTPDKNHCWPDGSIETKYFSWSIERKKIPKPSAAAKSLDYTGQDQTLVVANYNPNYMVASGDDLTQKEKASYSRTYSLTNPQNVIWQDGTTSDVVISWSIAAKKLVKPTLSQIELPYTGNSQSIMGYVMNYDSTYMTWTGVHTATNVGPHTLTFSLIDKENTTWTDGTTSDVALNWSIAKVIYQKIYASSTLVEWINKAVGPTFQNFDAARSAVNYSGILATNLGTYKAIFSLKDKTNTCWADGSTTDIEISWQIVPQTVATPTVKYPSGKDYFPYTNATVYAQFNNYNSSIMSVTGNSSTSTGTKTATFTITNTNYKFGNGTRSVSVTWKIAQDELPATTLTAQVGHIQSGGGITIETKYPSTDDAVLFSYSKQQFGLYIYIQFPKYWTFNNWTQTNAQIVQVDKASYQSFITVAPPKTGWDESCWLIQPVDHTKTLKCGVTIHDSSGVYKDKTVQVLRFT